MTYEACLAYIHGRPRFSSRRTDLSKVERLLERLGSPHRQGRFVHVTGTNGKGSACAFVASALQQAGYRTGLFTSPYLVRFEERFQVNRRPIAPDELAEIVTRVRAAEDQLEAEGYDGATEFEIVTVVGFCYFASRHCDYVVLEVGIGGRLDCTNVIGTPACACIMPVSFDHMKTLGGTLAEIAAEKAGIIKPGGRVVVSDGQPDEAIAVFRAVCAERGAQLIEAAQLPVAKLHMTRQGSECTIGGLPLHIPLLGRHQVTNAAAAVAVCRALGLPDETIAAGICRTDWPGRLQYLPGCPDLLLDAGHNPAGVATLLDTLDTLFPGVPVRVVMGMMHDKATGVCIPAMAKRAVQLYACAVDWPRAMHPDELAQVAAPFCPAAVCTSVRDALTRARAEAGPGELVVVCGSVYLVGDVLGILESE